MFTGIQSRALVVLSLGLVPIGYSLNGQSVTPADTAQDTKILLSYHVKSITRVSSGQFAMSGTVHAELSGRVTLLVEFGIGSSGQAGNAMVHSFWALQADPTSDSFKAKLTGTVELASCQTHPVGT